MTQDLQVLRNEVGIRILIACRHRIRRAIPVSVKGRKHREKVDNGYYSECDFCRVHMAQHARPHFIACSDTKLESSAKNAMANNVKINPMWLSFRTCEKKLITAKSNAYESHICDGVLFLICRQARRMSTGNPTTHCKISNGERSASAGSRPIPCARMLKP